MKKLLFIFLPILCFAQPWSPPEDDPLIKVRIDSNRVHALVDPKMDSVRVNVLLDGKQASLGYTAENLANKGVASGYASLTAGSLVPVAQLGSGTPSGSNYLRGDGTWATVSASVAWGGITGTLSNQTDLQSALDAKQNSLGFTPENSANKNAALGYAGLTASTKLNLAQIQEVPAVTDLTTYATTSGTGTQAIQATITTPISGEALKWNGSNWTNQTDATGGGGGLPDYVSVKRTADTTASANTPLGIGGMSFSVTSGKLYHYEYLLFYQAAALTTGIKVSLTYPAVTVASAGVAIYGQAADGATTEAWNGTINASADVVTSTAVAVVNQPYVCRIVGNILPSATGTLVLKWSPEVAAAATLKQGSLGYIWSF